MDHCLQTTLRSSEEFNSCCDIVEPSLEVKLADNGNVEGLMLYSAPNLASDTSLSSARQWFFSSLREKLSK